MCSRCPSRLLDIDIGLLASRDGSISNSSGALSLGALDASVSDITTSSSRSTKYYSPQNTTQSMNHQHSQASSSATMNSVSSSATKSRHSRKSLSSSRNGSSTGITPQNYGSIDLKSSQHRLHSSQNSQSFNNQDVVSSNSTPSKMMSSNNSSMNSSMSLLLPDLSSLGHDSSSLVGSSYSNAIHTWKDFFESTLKQPSSASPSTNLFSSPFSSNITTQMLGVPTPPQSNPIPSTPPSHHSSTHHFMNNIYNLPATPFNLVY